MPQSWRQHWTTTPDDDSAAAERDAIIHTLGNLTLFTGKLNPHVSNNPLAVHHRQRQTVQGKHAFAAWLVGQGWTVQFEVDWRDILAERLGHRLHVEAKGRTKSPGLDIDTAYGQLLRRMLTTDNPLDTYAFVIPEQPRSIRAATRVTPRIRQNLRIALYVVPHDGTVPSAGQ